MVMLTSDPVVHDCRARRQQLDELKAKKA